jgi:hypothetical protein
MEPVFGWTLLSPEATIAAWRQFSNQTSQEPPGIVGSFGPLDFVQRNRYDPAGEGSGALIARFAYQAQNPHAGVVVVHHRACAACRISSSNIGRSSFAFN